MRTTMDDHQIITLQSILLFFFFFFGIFIFTWRKKVQSGNLPPGPPWKLPAVGHMLHLVGSLPHHRRLRDLAGRYGPHVMHLQLGQTQNVVVSSAESAREVMKVQDANFANRPVMLTGTILCYDSTDVAFAPYGPYWRQLKKICTVELLSPKRVQSFRAIREEEMSRTIDNIKATAVVENRLVPITRIRARVVDLSTEMRRYTCNVIARSAFGEECRQAEEFLSSLKKGVELAGGFAVEDMFPSSTWLHVAFGARSNMEKVMKGLDSVLDAVITEHRRRRLRQERDDGEGGGDLVDILLQVQENGDLEFPLHDENIKAIILDVFSGGSDTSTSVIDWAMSEMLQNPRVLKKAQVEVRHRQLFDEAKNIVEEASVGELKYLKLVIKEALRLHPPVAMLIPRENVESCQIGGYDIPAKTKVIINAWAIGRDPRYWKQPDTFHPERFIDFDVNYKGSDFEFIPFGAGRRMCPGITFGLAAVELALANLLYHFDWELPKGRKLEDLDMTEAFGVTVNRKTNLCVIPVPYSPNT